MCMLQCLIISFLLLCLLYHQYQEVSKTDLLCACYSVWLFLFSFSVYSINNIRGWVKLNYYPCAVCARVMRLCSPVYVRTYVYVCVCVSSKNTLVYVSPLEILHNSALCSFFTESIVLWRRFLCWQALLERLIHGFLKLRVLVRALYGIVGVSPYLIDVLTQSHMYRTPESLLANHLLVHVWLLFYHQFIWSCLWTSCNAVSVAHGNAGVALSSEHG